MSWEGGRARALQQTHSVKSGENTSPESQSVALSKTMHTDHPDRSLPAHRRGTLRGMDAA
ncbi:hypothetical protein XarbCFBP7614_08280 [Xanthomonas arboricola]|nr:hypothetical protein XarbCFBP7614_08280 [Xanthomonas arboricola]